MPSCSPYSQVELGLLQLECKGENQGLPAVTLEKVHHLEREATNSFRAHAVYLDLLIIRAWIFCE